MIEFETCISFASTDEAIRCRYCQSTRCACNRREQCSASRSRANGVFGFVRPEGAGTEGLIRAEGNEACLIVETPRLLLPVQAKPFPLRPA